MTPSFPHTGILDDPAEVTAAFQRIARIGLTEDLGYGPDLTTLTSVGPEQVGEAEVRSRQAGVLSGIDAMAMVAEVGREFEDELGGTVTVDAHRANGDRLAAGDHIATVRGNLRALLQLERTMLNVVSHASGIATHTAAWVEAAGIAVRDSRKTLPGLRMLQKRAVLHGGGTPHRWGLGDQAMIKDNHVLSAGLLDSVHKIRTEHPDLWLEVEVDTLEQLAEVLETKPQQVLLDNFTVANTRRAVEMRAEFAPETLLESSGGLSFDVAADYGKTGVDSLAVGALTHSVQVLDIGLDLR